MHHMRSQVYYFHHCQVIDRVGATSGKLCKTEMEVSNVYDMEILRWQDDAIMAHLLSPAHVPVTVLYLGR
jgi:hypothetical protein